MPTLADIRGIVLDLDDTLYPEMDFVRAGFAAAAEVIASRVAAARAVKRMLVLQAAGQAKVFAALLAEMGAADAEETERRMVAAYRSTRPALRLHDDAKRLLGRAAGRFKLGLISDGWLETQRNKIEGLGIASRFDAVILTDELGRAYWKPHERAFREMAQRLACAEHELVYVADNPAKDFIAPNALGWTTIQIERADGIHRGRSSPPGGAAKQRVSSLDELTW